MQTDNDLKMDSIEETVREFIINNFLFGNVPAAGIPAEESLMESGIVDSTGILEIIEFLESTFTIKIDDEDLLPENLDSLSNIANFIIRKRSA